MDAAARAAPAGPTAPVAPTTNLAPSHNLWPAFSDGFALALVRLLVLACWPTAIAHIHGWPGCALHHPLLSVHLCVRVCALV